jgi:hypothetical protein
MWPTSAPATFIPARVQGVFAEDSVAMPEVELRSSDPRCLISIHLGSNPASGSMPDIDGDGALMKTCRVTDLLAPHLRRSASE